MLLLAQHNSININNNNSNNKSYIKESKPNILFYLMDVSFFLVDAHCPNNNLEKRKKRTNKKKTIRWTKKVFFCFLVIYTVFGIDLDLYFQLKKDGMNSSSGVQ